MTERDLSPREVEILTHAANGDNNIEIGARLWLSQDTVKTHVARVSRVLGARNRTHAVAIAISRGLITLEPQQKEH